MPTLTYPHWRDVPATAWRWPNFSVPLRFVVRFFCTGLAMHSPSCWRTPYGKTGTGVTPIPVSCVTA